MASTAGRKGARRVFETVSNSKLIAYSLTLFYPAGLVASCWWSLHGPSQDTPYYTFHAPSNHSKLDDSEYQALPRAIQKHRENITSQVIKFYSAKPDNNTEYIYDRDVTFEDPSTFTRGYTSMACLIYGLPNICTEATMKNIEVEHYDEAISLKFDYKFVMGPYKTLEFPVLLYLTLNEDNTKIVKHEDMWGGRPFFKLLGIEKIPKTINGYICRVIFGLQTGRLIR